LVKLIIIFILVMDYKSHAINLILDAKTKINIIIYFSQLQDFLSKQFQKLNFDRNCQKPFIE